MEANQLYETLVGLMNSEQLVTFLREYNISVHPILLDLFKMEELQIEKDVKI
jgi:hypothetical protein